MAPGILPSAISLRKSSPMRSSFCGLKCAPAGRSKLPSAPAVAIDATQNNSAAPASSRNAIEFIALPAPTHGSLAVGSIHTRARGPLQHRTMQSGARFGEAAEDDLRDGGRGRQCADDGGHSNIRRPFGGKSIDAGGDRGKCHRGKAIRLTKLKRAAIARRQRLILALAAAM